MPDSDPRPMAEETAVAEIAYMAGSDGSATEARSLIRLILVAALLNGVAQVVEVMLVVAQYDLVRVHGIGNISFTAKLYGLGLFTSTTTTCSLFGGLAFAVGAVFQLTRRKYLRGGLLITIGGILLLADVWFTHFHYRVVHTIDSVIAGDLSTSIEQLSRGVVALGIYACVPMLVLSLSVTGRLELAKVR